MILKMLKPIPFFGTTKGISVLDFDYAGVCCCESLEELKAYFNTSILGTDALKDSCIFVFDGDWVDSNAMTVKSTFGMNPTEINYG